MKHDSTMWNYIKCSTTTKRGRRSVWSATSWKSCNCYCQTRDGECTEYYKFSGSILVHADSIRNGAKDLHQMLKFLWYKISAVQELLPGDAATWMDSSLIFLARIQVHDTWPRQILWSNEAHFHLNRGINIHNYRILSVKNLHTCVQDPLHLLKVTVSYFFTASFIIGPYFYEENRTNGPVISTADRYAGMLQDSLVQQLQQRGCLHSTIFMRDGVPPHTGFQVRCVLRHHFSDSRVN